MSNTHGPGSEEVRLRDGICGAWDLVYFPPWISVIPAGFSQVLASIRRGSWEEGRGIQGFSRGGGAGAGGGKDDGAGVCHTQLSTAGETERKSVSRAR